MILWLHQRYDLTNQIQDDRVVLDQQVALCTPIEIYA